MRASLLGLFALLALIARCTTPTSTREKPPLACHASGMCSIGHSKRFVGDIRPSAGLRTFLSSIAHKKEIILICYQRYSTFLEEAAIHLHYELLALGFAHHAFLGYVQGESHMDKEEGGEKVDSCADLTSIAPFLSCAWDSTYVPDWIVTYSEDRLWHYRWKTMVGLSFTYETNPLILPGS